MSKYFTFCILLSVSLLANGQKLWTLDDCIQQAINQNLELMEASIDNKIRNEDLRQSRLDLLPSLNGYLSSDNSYGRTIDPSNNEIVSTQLFQASASAGASLVLFQGFINMNRVQFNKLNVLKGSLTEEKLKNDIVFRVMNAYFDLCFSKGQLQIAQDQYKLSVFNLKKMQVMVEAGIKAGTDLAEMKARLAQDDFKHTQARNNVQKSKLVLQHLLNNNDDLSFDIADESRLINIEFQALPDPDSVYHLAEKHLPQFSEMLVDSRISNINLAIARGSRVPVLRAQAGYGTAFFDSNKDQYGNLIRFNNQLINNGYQYVGLNLSIPIFNNGLTYRNINNARWNVEKTTIKNEMNKRDFYTEIKNACLALKSAADEYHSALLQEESTSMNLQFVEKKWEQGTGNLLELTDARNRKASAQAEILRTQLQFTLKRKTIEIFTGGLKIN